MNDSAVAQLLDQLSAPYREKFLSLSSPFDIQAFLDETPYSAENANRCPRRVLEDERAHCLDGALFAAAALRRLSYPPLVINLIPAEKVDDDHVLAVFQREGRFGAIAKSNFAGLRFREPIYRNLRELAMSYFEWYFNIEGVKTLRGYTQILDLNKLDKYEWMTSDRGADMVEQRIHRLRRYPLFPPEAAALLSPAHSLTYQAGMVGVNPNGLFKPEVKRG